MTFFTFNGVKDVCGSMAERLKDFIKLVMDEKITVMMKKRDGCYNSHSHYATSIQRLLNSWKHKYSYV